jgi:hypothetical protein
VIVIVSIHVILIAVVTIIINVILNFIVQILVTADTPRTGTSFPVPPTNVLFRWLVFANLPVIVYSNHQSIMIVVVPVVAMSLLCPHHFPVKIQNLLPHPPGSCSSSSQPSPVQLLKLSYVWPTHVWRQSCQHPPLLSANILKFPSAKDLASFLFLWT